MKTLLVFLSLAAVGCSACFQETPYPDTIDEGFVSLFDGTDLAAWEGSPLFKVEAIETRLANGTVKPVDWDDVEARLSALRAESLRVLEESLADVEGR